MIIPATTAKTREASKTFRSLHRLFKSGAIFVLRAFKIREKQTIILFIEFLYLKVANPRRIIA
jgi:hypothetical protein